MIMVAETEPPLVLSHPAYMDCHENGANILNETNDDHSFETKVLVKPVDLNSVCDVDNSSDDDEPLFMTRIREKIIHSSDEDDSTPCLNSNKLPSPAKSVGSELRIGRILDEDFDADECVSSHGAIQECKPKGKIHYSRAIFDTETTDEEDNQDAESLPNLDSSDDGSSSKVASPKDKAKKSCKSRNEERKEIRSVTQRMIRESRVSLPYHRPKQRTLLDFLQRKKSASCIGKRKSLKMSMKDLDYLREIEKRKDEVDIFFKSDSEDESSEIRTEENCDTLPIIGDGAPKELVKDILVQSSLYHVSENPTQNTNNELPPPIEDETKDGRSQETSEIFIDDDNSRLTARKNSTNEMPSQIKDIEVIKKMPLLIEGEISGESTNQNKTEISLFETCEKSTEEKMNQSGTQVEDDSAKECIFKLCKMPFESEIQGEVSGVQTFNTMLVDTCPLPDLEHFVHIGQVPSAVDGFMTSNVKPNCSATTLDNISELEMCQHSEEGLLNSHNSNKKIEILEEEEDFKLHLETEDFETNVHTMKMFNEESDISSKEVESTHEASSVKVSHKLNRLVTKFPHLNINKLTDIKPKLSVSDGDFIDLDEERYNRPLRGNGVSNLLHRFVRHSSTKTKSAAPQQVMLGVVSKEISSDGEEKLIHSNICVNVDSKKDIEPNNETPGARLVQLKTTLRSQLLKQREQERQRKVNEKQFLESENIIQDSPDDGLPQDEPILTDESDTETESEPEEEDVPLEDRPYKKNQFVDDEAEEEEEEDCHPDDDECDYTGGQFPDQACKDVENKIDAGETSEDEDSQSVPPLLKRKPVNRISDDDEEESTTEQMEDSWTIRYLGDKSFATDVSKRCQEDADTQDAIVEKPYSSNTLSRMNTNEDMFVTQSEDSIGDTCPQIPREASLEATEPSLDWQDSSHLPGYQPARSEESRQRLSDVGEASLEASMNSSGLTLFSKLEYVQHSNIMDDKVDNGPVSSALNLLLTPMKESQVSSGNTQSIKRSLLLDVPAETALKNSSTTDELLSLCSGKFTPDNSKNFSSLGLNVESVTQNLDEMVGLCSGRFDTQNIADHSQMNSEGVELDNAAKQSTIVEEENGSVSCDWIKDSGIEEKQGFVYSSDEEGILHRQKQAQKRGKRKRIVTLCDDEDSDNDSLEYLSDAGEESEVEYDENEEPIIKEKCTRFKDSRGGIRADFLENEAELSGSEEGSDDEEEPDVDHDFMELEEGDADKFDEEELRHQVGRAHMKSMIDTDKRELRLLQELYLEDGDLHGEGRRKQFRWRNIDKALVDPDQLVDEVEEEEHIASEELEWRRQRLEREKFLQEHEQQQEKVSSKIEDSFSGHDSSLKLVQSVKKNLMPLKPLNSSPRDSPLFLNTRAKRGSFLSRDESTLKRLAEFANENDGVGTARQSGNFVFHTLTEEEAEARMSKRRTSQNVGDPPEKKLKMERSFFSMEESSRSKSIFKYL